MVTAGLVALAVAAAPAPRVIAIQPEAPTLPATTLRIYVLFDKSARGWVRQDAVRLLTAEGRRIVPSPFMDFGQELWSPDGRRLTVLFDPGRVKRDVEGPGSDAAPLKPGRSYQIGVGGYRTTFRVGPPNRSPVDPTVWRLSTPPTPRAPLTVTFDRVMDSALVADEMAVIASDGKPVAGRAELDPDGMTWRFTPTRPWAGGDYRVIAGSMLEDVSGNRIGEALDHDAGRPDARPTPAALPFMINRRLPSSRDEKRQ